MWVSLRLELPCAPFMPMYQLLVPDGSNEPVCKGIFGMLMLDTETMSVLEDQKVYEKVATPLREAFRIRRPTGNEGVPKFPRIYPPRGTPFTPTQLYCTTYTIMPSDCDMYRVIFHPQMVSVCDKVNYKADLPFTKEPAVAIYANLAKPAGVDECFDVRIFIDPASATCRQPTTPDTWPSSWSTVPRPVCSTQRKSAAAAPRNFRPSRPLRCAGSSATTWTIAST